jgi:TolB protein
MNVRIVAAAIFGASLLVPSSAVSAAGGYTSRVNLTDTGAQATEYRSEVAAMTPGARYIVFTSAAPNLADGDTNETWDVFLRDRQTASTTLISVSLTGTPADSSSYGNAVSADGRYVMVTSLASNLVPGDGGDNVFQVYVRDRWLRTTSRVSESGTGVPANGSTYGNAMSPDGRYLALASDATNLVPGDTNDATDVFIRDRARNTIDRVNVSTAGAEANAGSYEVAVSADGRYVAFTSDATNLVPGDTNDATDVFIRDRARNTTSRLSLSGGGRQADAGSRHVSLSSDGRYVAFTSDATNLVPGDTNGNSDVFVRDRDRNGTERMSLSGVAAQAVGDSYDTSLSSDGRYVAFTSDAANLVPGDTNGNSDVFVRDRRSRAITRASLSSIGVEGNDFSAGPALAPDGRFIAFDSIATNLVPGDTNAVGDVFLRRLA